MDTTPNETPSGAPSHEQTPSQEQQPPLPPPGPAHAGEQRLHRATRGRMLAGVAAGVADYFDVDPTLVRIGFVVLAFMGGLAIPLYLAGWLLIPDDENDVSVAEELLSREHARSAY